MAPLTLLQRSGAIAEAADWQKAVIVVIDAQNDYIDGSLPLTGVEAAVAEIRSLLDLAREDGVPVVHVIHKSGAGSWLFDPGSHGAEIIAALAPVNGERVVEKTLPNAFAGTDLHAVLTGIAKETGRSELVLTGFMTHMCVGATARAALDLGFKSTVIASATATRDLPDPLGGMIPAETVQRTALAEIADRFATVARDISAVAKRAAKV